MDTVSHTLFFPLLGRSQAATDYPDLFTQPPFGNAEEIARKTQTPAQPMGAFPAFVYGLRHEITVIMAKRYLEEHPGAAVVNLGCGLDQLAHDLTDYECTVYNLDFPSVIEVRQKWLTALENEVDLPYSLTDTAWFDQVDGTKGVIAIAAGVFYYLKPDAVATFMDEFGKRFPGAWLTYDSESPRVIRMSERSIAKKGTPTTMPFKLADPFEVRTFSPTIANVAVNYSFANYLPVASRRTIPKPIRVAFWFFEKIKGMYQVTITFAGSPSDSGR